VSTYSNIAILGTSVLLTGSVFSQQQGSGLNPSKTSGTVSPTASVAIFDPPFHKHPIQFEPNSLELTVAGRNILQRAAIWLRQHREARILIVGSCDSGGSETFTHTLAEARGAAARKFLGSSGIDSDQIVGVKGWDSLDQSCRTTEVECQKFNRSARIFIASTAAH
jgi:outer membrane protein OmpA-like peptidoglycan-associated protein